MVAHEQSASRKVGSDVSMCVCPCSFGPDYDSRTATRKAIW